MHRPAALPLPAPMAPGPPPSADRPATAIQAAARLLADGEIGEAARRLEALVQAAPAYPAAHVLLAKAYEAAERWDDALGAWHQAYFLVPGSPLVRRERQRLLDAQVRAALPADWSRPTPTAPSEGGSAPAEPLADEPGGTLPDAHQAFAPEASDVGEAEPEAPPSSAFQETEPVQAKAEAAVEPEEPEEPEAALSEFGPYESTDTAEAEPPVAEPTVAEPTVAEPTEPTFPYEPAPYAAPPYQSPPTDAGDLAEPAEKIDHEG